MMQKINEELLLKNGYKEYEPSPLHGDYVKKCFQKCFHKDHSKLYFINFMKWEFNVHNDVEVHWEAEVQLYSRGSHEAVDLTFHNGWTLDTIERYVKQIYNIGFEPYEEEE